MYVEDMEYSYRIKRNGGKLLTISNSEIYHKVGGASGGDLSPFSIYWISRNKIKFICENLRGIDFLTSLFVSLIIYKQCFKL